MTHNAEFKPKSGYVYVVTNECLNLVRAKGVFKQMLELGVADREFYAKLSKIVEGHLKSCGAKGDAK